MPTPTPTPTPSPAPPLALTCPAAMEVEAQGPSSSTVVYQPPQTTGGQAPIATVCTPASGTSFPVGTATVTCQATDAAAQRASCSFTVTVRPRPPAPRVSATKYVAFGDSMTEGTLSDVPLVMSAVTYPGSLHVLLSSRYTDQTIAVTNAGKAGELASEAQGRFTSVLATARPEVVLLMEGVNDLARHQQPGISLAADAIDRMTRQAQGSGVRVFIATLPPERPGGKRACCIPYLDAYNAALKDIAIRDRADLVDINALVPVSLIGGDGLHPTEAGYQRIAEIFFDAIRNNLEVPVSASRFR